MKFNRNYYIAVFLFIIVLLAVFLSMIFYHPGTTVNAGSKRTGISIDCARSFKNVNFIKKYINEIHKNKGNYLTLHLTDNENFAVENESLHQTISNAYYKSGIYYNKKTKLPFLSKNQLKNIIHYGNSKHVEVIPEIDVPGHAQGIFSLLKANGEYNLYKQVVRSDGYNEMDYAKEKTLSLSKRIIGEYIPLIKAGDYISIGGDEITVNNDKQEDQIVKYINSMDSYINQHSIKMTMWNDAFHKKVINKYNKNILIDYWSYSGQRASQEQSNQNMALRATMPELNKAGFKTINCNFYYLYLIANEKIFNKHNVQFWKNDLMKWNPKIWNNNDNTSLDKSKNNIGMQLSIWNDGSYKINNLDLYNNLKTYIKSYLNYSNSF
ncbi:family 20 glycosylhydrolase [Apilactobacillus quenuiae]|uniref:family 20 glycosylhydrolase n=1 Tax=Apilactobacillus quenuiae TaxID=2008377 RepID=UPI000D01487C|nr:family 20 glycosylhydrolase [Apilactobacillus quenuiae]